MEKITPKKLREVIGIHYKTKTPIFVYGGFGIGKSTIVKDSGVEIAKERKKEFVEWGKTTKEKKMEMLKNPEKYFVIIDERLSQYEPSDLKGLPKFDDENEHLEWSIPLFLVYLSKPKADGILFFDELNLAPPSVQASCYQIFHDREVNGEKLSDDVLVMGCGNRLSDKAHTYDIPLPLRDRKSEYELVIDNDEWINWALENGIDKDIIAFLKFRGDYLLKIESDRDNKSITPRGWERTSKLIKGMDAEKNSNLLKTIISGSIGCGVASEYLAFIRLQKSINIDDILKNPEKVKDITGVDLRYSLISGLSKKYEKDRKVLEKLLYVCKNLQAEYGVLLIKLLKSITPLKLGNDLVKLDVWNKDLGVEYGKYLL